MILGVGILAERFGAGPGLTGLGAGIRALAAAPLGGAGAGLGEFAGGLRAIGESFGDIGRGFASIFEAIPAIPWVTPPPAEGQGYPWIEAPAVTEPGLITVAGGSGSTLAAGGGANVPKNGGVYYVGTIAGGGYTFPGAKTIWVKESAAMKHYKAAQNVGGNNV